MMDLKQTTQRGFTLVEMIIVIAMTGAIAALVAVFIRAPIIGYVDTVARADITDTGDIALRRIARDVRLALPNSVRATTDASGNQYLEMLLTRTGGRYLAAEDGPTPAGHPLSFTDSTKTSFDIVGLPPSGPQAIQLGDSIVVYNLGVGTSPTDAYASPATNSAVVSSITTSGGVMTIGMASNPFAGPPATTPSPYHRFQVVIGPVTYRWDATAHTITRYWNYKLSETQPSSLIALSAGNNSALIAAGVSACSFVYQPTQQSNALLEASISLTAPSTDISNNAGTIGLFQQVHVDNTP
jgi:MSHA biogenesis protein MshO